MRQRWYFWTPKIVAGMAKEFAKYIDECEEKKKECHPFVTPFTSHVLQPKHFDFVIRCCDHAAKNDILKVRKMIQAAAKRTTDKNGCFHHNGAETCLIAFLPFMDRDIDWGYYKRIHEKKHGVGTWGQH